MGSKLPEIIGAIGDCNPFDNGGGLVLDHGDGYPTLIWFKPVTWEDKHKNIEKVEVYRVSLDKRQVLGDVGWGEDVYTLDSYTNPIPWKEINRDMADQSQFGYAWGGCPLSPGSYTEWWDDKIEDIARINGLTVEELRKAECSCDPVQRAWFMWAVAAYYGWSDINGGDPDVEMITELRKSWALRMWRARKKGIQVYT